jgi:hypothetical protein
MIFSAAPLRRVPAAFAILALALALSPKPAEAGSVWLQQSYAAWHKQDQCARQAFKRFPDYTTESNRQRDRAMRECEANNHVLPRDDIHESPVGKIPDAEAN